MFNTISDQLSNGAEYLASSEPALLRQRIGQSSVSVDDALKYLSGKEYANKQNWNLINSLGGAKGQLEGSPFKKQLARFAGKGYMRPLFRILPATTAVMAAGDLADSFAGDQNMGDSIRDLLAMLGGGAAGFALGGGPIGAFTGASFAKNILSDPFDTTSEKALMQQLANRNVGIG